MRVVAEGDGEAEEARDDDGVRRDLEHPFRRRVEEVAHNDLVADDQGSEQQQAASQDSCRMRDLAENAVIEQNNIFE